MKKFLSAILVIFFLSACGVSVTPSPTPTETIFPTTTSSNTPIPTPTFTPTPTEVPIPEFMNEFIELGYDIQFTDSNAIHIVLSEASLTYAPTDSGISYQSLTVFSWLTVSYIDDNNQYREGIVLNNVCRTEGNNIGRFTSALTDGSQLTPNRACPGMPYFRGQNRDLFVALPGEYHILKAFLGTGFDSNKDMIYDGIFPTSDSNLQNLNIPGIGEVLPITVFRLPDSPSN